MKAVKKDIIQNRSDRNFRHGSKLNAHPQKEKKIGVTCRSNNHGNIFYHSQWIQSSRANPVTAPECFIGDTVHATATVVTWKKISSSLKKVSDQ